MYSQRILRSTCASMQTDQSHRCPNEASFDVKLSIKNTLIILLILTRHTGWTIYVFTGWITPKTRILAALLIVRRLRKGMTKIEKSISHSFQQRHLPKCWIFLSCILRLAICSGCALSTDDGSCKRAALSHRARKLVVQQINSSKGNTVRNNGAKVQCSIPWWDYS